jgi:hypothetical protein
MIVMLKTLIDPRWTAVCGEDHQSDQDQTEQQRPKILAREDAFHKEGWWTIDRGQ